MQFDHEWRFSKEEFYRDIGVFRLQMICAARGVKLVVEPACMR